MRFERSDEMPRGVDSVYDWICQFTFSRPMKTPARDFSDAVLLAEILAQLVPAWVQLHNYPSTLRFQQKLSNWETLNRKVLTRLKCGISLKHQEDLANAVPGAVELLLIQVKRATANSPFLQAKHASTTSTSPRSQSSSATCSPPSTPTPAKQRLSPSSLKIHTSESSHEQSTITTSFSKLLQLMSDTTREFDDVMKPVDPKPRSRANTAPNLELDGQLRRNMTQPLTPNYAKPTLSTMAMTRPASVDAKPRLPQASPFVFPTKNDQISRASFPQRPQVSPDASKKYLPSDTNEFQEGSFVYFLSSEALPAAYLFADPEDQAQVARVIKTLPSGECTLQLYRRVPSRDSPQNSPNKTRCYFATPHFIDCCSTLLHTIPNIVFDPQTNTCEWHVRGRKTKSSESTETRHKPAQNNSPPATHRHFYTQVLTRLTFTPANLAEPISQTTESVSPGVCLPCPSFAESFRVPVAPTVFPKVRVSLNFELPDRFPRCSHRRQLQRQLLVV